MTRRDFVGTLTVLAATSCMNHFSPWALPYTSRPHGPRGKSLRIANLTDIHLEPGGQAAEGFRACLQHVHSLETPPELILNGGDAIMDAFKADDSHVSAQWELWQKLLIRHASIPIRHCLGNHDVWKEEPEPSGARLLRGKRRAMQAYGMKDRYYSFDLGSWHFIVLDSTNLRGDHYQARLDDEQFAWLKADLESVPSGRPVLVQSHIPILSACAFFDGDNESEKSWSVSGAWMHIDARRLKDLFAKHRNVRICLSGHIHLLDRVEYNGVTYICNGAVCGDWWRGMYQECPPGYGLVDLYADGSFDHQYVIYR